MITYLNHAARKYGKKIWTIRTVCLLNEKPFLKITDNEWIAEHILAYKDGLGTVCPAYDRPENVPKVILKWVNNRLNAKKHFNITEKD